MYMKNDETNFILTCFWYFSFTFYVKKKKEKRKEERDIKYNEKDTFTPIFNGENGEVGNRGLMEATLSGLIDNF